MLPGGPVCPVDPRNEQGVTRRHRPHGLDDGRSDSGLLRRFVIARNPESVCLHDERRAEARPTPSVMPSQVCVISSS